MILGYNLYLYNCQIILSYNIPMNNFLNKFLQKENKNFEDNIQNLLKQNKFEAIIKNCNNFLETNNNIEQEQLCKVYFYRSYSCSQIGNYEQAFLDLNKLIDINLRPSFYYKRALINLKLKSYKNALKDCKICEELIIKTNQNEGVDLEKIYNLKNLIFEFVKANIEFKDLIFQFGKYNLNEDLKYIENMKEGFNLEDKTKLTDFITNEEN